MNQKPTSIHAVIFDWAGTTIDHGSIAPTVAFRQIFADHDITVTDEQIRTPMGKGKRDHIAEMISMPDIQAAWNNRYGANPGEAEIDDLYSNYGDVIDRAIAAHSELIPELLPALDALREQGLRIGSTTGYVRSMMEPVLKTAANAGYSPEVTVCSDEVPSGRPAPWMMFEAMRQLDVYPASAIVKVGDTTQDIHEALNAGAWAVGVARTGNSVGLSLEDWEALDSAEQTRKLQAARAELEAAGAHFVIDSLSELPVVITQIAAGNRY